MQLMQTNGDLKMTKKQSRLSKPLPTPKDRSRMPLQQLLEPQETPVSLQNLQRDLLKLSEEELQTAILNASRSATLDALSMIRKRVAQAEMNLRKT